MSLSMKNQFLSSLEWKVLLLFFTGIISNHLYTQHPLLFVVMLYLFGLIFEYSTKDLWFYNPIIKQNLFTIKGVNILLGLGWVGALLLGICLAKFLSINFSVHYWLPSLMLGIGVVGNLAEQVFYNLKLYTYNLNSRLIALPTKKVILVWNIPLGVRIGYFTHLPLIIYLLLKTFQ